MPETNVVDEVVSERAPATRSGGTARPVTNETVEASTGNTRQQARPGVEEESYADGGRKGRVFKESTEKLLQEFDKRPEPAPHEVGDGDEDEPEEEAPEADASADAADEGDADEGGEEGEGEESKEEAPDPAAEWQTKAQTLEQRNRELIAELDTARKTPKAERTERESALLAAEQTYIDEGTVPALRKFLGVIVGAAPDSKEVDAELAGLFTDLSAHELGVALDQNQQALRDNARTRLLLARDKREKVEGSKKAEPGNGAAEAVQYETAARHVDNLLITKGQSGTSIADEYPMLMSLAEDFDGYKPGEVLARAIKQEIEVGTLDPKISDVDMIRAVAPKIESYYEKLANKIETARAKKTKPDTTTPSVKPKAAPEQSKEQRQSHGARTISNAAASRAPAKPPKAPTKQKAATTAKTRKDFPNDAAYRQYLLELHFPS